MGKDTGIQWTHHTFNPWWGCAKVSPGCKNCYAETFSRRVGFAVWGQDGERRTFGDKHWDGPRVWNAAAAKAGERRRVFCASMADVFEDHPVAEARRPALWASGDPFDAPAPVFGAYPKGFVLQAARWLGAAPAEVLHVCSGMLTPEDGGFRVDLRAAARPTVRADGRALPFRDGVFSAVMIDPPYSVEYAADLYGTDYPRPSHLLAEAARVVRPGGRIGLLHFIVPFPPPGCRFVTVKGVTTGCGYRIRAFTILERAHDQLPGVGA